MLSIAQSHYDKFHNNAVYRHTLINTSLAPVQISQWHNIILQRDETSHSVGQSASLYKSHFDNENTTHQFWIGGNIPWCNRDVFRDFQRGWSSRLVDERLRNNCPDSSLAGHVLGREGDSLTSTISDGVSWREQNTRQGWLSFWLAPSLLFGESSYPYRGLWVSYYMVDEDGIVRDILVCDNALLQVDFRNLFFDTFVGLLRIVVGFIFLYSISRRNRCIMLGSVEGLRL